MQSEAKVLISGKKEAVVLNLKLKEGQYSFQEFVSTRMKEWAKDLMFWQGEANEYVKLLRVGRRLENLSVEKQSPLQILNHLTATTIPKLIESINQSRMWDKDGNLDSLDQIQEEYDRIKHQFAAVKSLVLAKVIERYPVTFF